MEPVEINAGDHYLRQLRADKLIDDRPALIEAAADPQFRRFVPKLRIDDLAQAEAYVRLRAREWAEDLRYSWAIAEPATGGLLGEVGLIQPDLDAGTAEASIWVRPGARGHGVATTSVGTIVRFGFGALGLREIRYGHTEANGASAKVAERCGFRFAGRVDVEGRTDPDLRWTLSAGSAR